MPTRRGRTFDPTSVYRKEVIEGYTVLINPKVLRHSGKAVQVRKELQDQLRRIYHAVPAKPLIDLRNVKIWVEWESGAREAPMFHPWPEWLEKEGYNPDKLRGIELSNTSKFIKWSRAEQPWLILHEFAHAYQHLVLGVNHSGILAAYTNAMSQKIYESVPYINGGMQPAYALTDKEEYFAELSEAYFGKNDYYPFIRSELEKHDPVGYQLMEDTWGKPRN